MGSFIAYQVQITTQGENHKNIAQNKKIKGGAKNKFWGQKMISVEKYVHTSFYI